MKKHILSLLLVLALSGPATAQAQGTPSITLPEVQVTATAPSNNGFVPLAPIPGLDQGVNATQQGIADFLSNLYIFAIGIAVILAVGMIIYGGVEYAFSGAEITSKTAGRRRITQALYGLVLVLAPVLVFSIINPAILNLNVNFPALDTKWGTYSGSSGKTVPIDTAGNPVTNPVTCGSDGCSSQISACVGTSISQCTPASGGNTYTPGSSGCKAGDTFQCTTVNFGQVQVPG